MTPVERAAMMRKLGAVLERRCAELDAAWIGQVGVPVSMARGSGIGASMLLSYYADLAEKTVFEDVRPSQGFVSKYGSRRLRSQLGSSLRLIPGTGR